jgi:hypothetical protein
LRWQRGELSIECNVSEQPQHQRHDTSDARERQLRIEIGDQLYTRGFAAHCMRNVEIET